MIVNEIFLEKARSAFDLNEYEVKTWVALLSRGESTAGELAEISTVPRSRVYDILESLTKKGYVIKKNGTPIKYKTVPPEEALKAAKRNALKKAEEEANNFDKVKSTEPYKELEKFYKQGSGALQSSLSSIITGRKNIHAQLCLMLNEAKKSIIIATTKEGVLRKAEKLSTELKKAKERGVSIKIAAPIESISQLPEELRNIADIKKANRNARFVIVDDKHTLFMTNDDKDVHEAYDIGIWTNSPLIAKAVEHLFNNNWQKMEKL